MPRKQRCGKIKSSGELQGEFNGQHRGDSFQTKAKENFKVMKRMFGNTEGKIRISIMVMEISMDMDKDKGKVKRICGNTADKIHISMKGLVKTIL